MTWGLLISGVAAVISWLVAERCCVYLSWHWWANMAASAANGAVILKYIL